MFRPQRSSALHRILAKISDSPSKQPRGLTGDRALVLWSLDGLNRFVPRKFASIRALGPLNVLPLTL